MKAVFHTALRTQHDDALPNLCVVSSRVYFEKRREGVPFIKLSLRCTRCTVKFEVESFHDPRTGDASSASHSSFEVKRTGHHVHDAKKKVLITGADRDELAEEVSVIFIYFNKSACAKYSY